MTALEKLKLKLGITDAGQDALLSLMLEEAEETILDIIGRTALPERLESVQTALAVIAYNRRGDEGEASVSENGVSFSLIDGLPAELKARLKNYPRKVRVIGDASD